MFEDIVILLSYAGYVKGFKLCF